MIAGANVRYRIAKQSSNSRDQIAILCLHLEEGAGVNVETVRRWFLKFGSTIAANLRRTRPRPSDHWHSMKWWSSSGETLLALAGRGQ